MKEEGAVKTELKKRTGSGGECGRQEHKSKRRVVCRQQKKRLEERHQPDASDGKRADHSKCL